ncbi:hypothetical protein ABFS82_13G176500 [Erythranthe guttata]|uniref:Wound-responsive family protein n=1 Tax=Erythranthe guttata TaxID=4155 RepID=A0A022PUF9_ERYGU|nr:PREDICTED: uncharacterized protein LOC105948734 [Erythranthe guttata]EYU19174.1 hypothetical protein MIMGU_mgv1a017162mg [Erythranthe guttata]|eukprot:XP_012827416.1 PREDICTED: uncharacterized protein LOC105948734 [Erythranthe guttata]
MSSSRRAWLVAASIGVVEALKDQGFCRWNYAARVIQQRTKNNLKSYTNQVQKISSASSSSMVSMKMKEHRLKESEESLRKVMYLSCWGPN